MIKDSDRSRPEWPGHRLFFSNGVAMKILLMLLFFEGEGAPVESAKGFVHSRAKGTFIGALRGSLPEEAVLTVFEGGAAFDTMVYGRGDQFWEAGRVDFPGVASHLLVETEHAGTTQMANDGSSSGSICWKILGGGGRFQDASGNVTGNFTARPDGHFFDHQLYKVMLPS